MNQSTLPNVVFIIADDWSPIAECYNQPAIRTPNIDQLAQQGTTFTNAFCTSPSCAVSRACILTGHQSHQHGQYGHSHLPHGFTTNDHVQTLPAILKAHGYRTACIGKNHVAPAALYPFDTTDKGEAFSTRSLNGLFETFVKQAPQQPFFAMIASLYPHRVGSGYALDQHGDEFARIRPYDPSDVVVPDFLPDTPQVRQDLAEYYEAIERYDHLVGTIRETIRRLCLQDNTMVIVTTDHGMPFPGAKASSFEAGHHCPLLIHAPGRKAGIRCNALVNWTDFAPTIYQWCRVPAEQWPASLAGRSMLEILDQTDPRGWDETYLSHCSHEVTNYFPYRILRGRRYKYVRHLAWQLPMPLPTDLFRSPTWQCVREQDITELGRRSASRLFHHPREGLFDLQTDPLENVNLIDDPAVSEVACAMRQRMQQWREQTKDPWLEIDFQESGTAPAPALAAARHGQHPSG